MKKHILLTILAAAGAVLSSCNSVEPVTVPGNGFTIKLDSGGMITKASDEVSFEDKVDAFDYFFFDDADGAVPTAGLHGHVDGNSVTLLTGVGQDFEALRLGTHYVYILANYPTRLNHNRDYTLEELLSLDFISNLANRNASSDQVTFGDNMVMDSYNAETGKYLTELTPKAVNEQRVETIYLSRIAAKLTFTINVAEQVAGTMDDTWKPVLKDLRAYFVNALNNYSTVSGTPIVRSEAERVLPVKYLNYPETYPYTQVEGNQFSFVTDPFYTYPQTWNTEDNGEPYLKIALTWVSNKRGTTTLYYKVTVPKPDVNKRTISRNTWYNVDVDLSVVDSADDYIDIDGRYTIHPWSGSSTPGGSPLSSARFFDVPTRSFSIFSLESLPVPFSSSSNIEAFFTEISYDYYGDKDTKSYDFTFLESDKRNSVILPTSYNGATIPAAGRDLNRYSLTVEGKTVVLAHSLDNIYTVRNITFVLQQQDNTDNRAVITVTQHPAIEIIKHQTNSMFVNGYFGHVALPVDGDGEPFARRSSNMYTWQYAAQNPDLPSVYYHSSNNTTGTTLNQNGTFNFTDNSTGWGSVYGNTGFDSSISQTPFMTEVVVSAFDETNDKYTIRYGSETADPENKQYRIGDPRKTAGSQGYAETWLLDYLFNETYSGSTVTEHRRAWQEPLEVLIASQNASDREVIAPRFLISSALNVTGGVYWYGAVRRAATYQEAGYPAGRWRLPTEAEIAFIMARQQEGSLPTLFANTSIYWSADGRVLKGQKGHPIISYARPGTSGADPDISRDRPLRFVYDLWYWGDEPADPNMYHPNGHIIPYTTN